MPTPRITDFYLGPEVVGRFTGEPPATDGVHPYEPYRGPGHFHLGEALKRGETPGCSYTNGTVRMLFQVVGCPSYGHLQLANFTKPAIP